MTLALHRRNRTTSTGTVRTLKVCHLILITASCFTVPIEVYSPATLHGQTLGDLKAAELSTSEVVSKMVAMNQKRANSLQSFTSQRTYELDYRGFPSHKHARMIVDARFEAPQNKELKIISEEGSELLRNRVLRKLVDSELEAGDRSNRTATALTEANYSFSLVGREQMDGRDCYVLNVSARTRSKFLYDGKIWVDAEDFAVVHIRARPAKNPSFWIKRVDIEHQYEKIGAFWLPKTNQSTSSVRLGGRAALKIDYGSYKIEPREALVPDRSSTHGTMQ